MSIVFKVIHVTLWAASAVIVLPCVFVAGVISGLLGVAVSPVVVSAKTLTHETIPEEARGRIFSSLEAVIHLAFLVFMFVAAYAAKIVDRFWIIVAVGLVYFICGVARLFTSSRTSLS